MKDKVLDDAFLQPDIFSDFTKEEETIIWKGNPSEQYKATLLEGNKKNLGELVKILLSFLGITIVLSSILFFINPIPIDKVLFYFILTSWILLFIHSLGFLYSEYQMFVLKKNTKYAITNNLILFSKHDSLDNSVGIIGFFEIDSYSIILDKNEVKTFSIKVNSPKYSLDSYDFENGKRREHATLELIEDFEIVEELLQKGIEKYKKL